MTVEELEDKADEWVEFTYDRLYYPDSNFLARIDARNAFIAGAKLMQKELEKEKCELLGLIQAKDKLIKKMKSCGGEEDSD